VASLRVQAVVVNPASASDPSTSHLVVIRDMAKPFHLMVRCGGGANLPSATRSV
jgi:hypothetical protein